MAKRDDIDQFNAIVEYSCMDHYYLLFKNFFANHLAHAQVALYRMGAPMERIKAYTDEYVKKLDPRGGPLNQRDDALVESFDSVEDLRGKNSRFYVVLDHFNDLLKNHYNDNLEDFIAGEFPKLSLGVGDSLLHPLIHIGYGYSVKSAKIVVEGMAYLHIAYYELKLTSTSAENLGKGDKSFLEVAELIRNDDTIYDAMLTDLKNNNKSGLINRMRTLLEHNGDDLLKFAHMLDCPRNPEDLANWIIDSAITLFAMAENRNDFVYLHGVTSSWALSNILPLIKSEETKVEIGQAFICILLGAYIVKDRPILNPEYFEGTDEGSWDDLLAKLFGSDKMLEEHRYKLVHVCYEASLRNPSKSASYLKAAKITLDYHYHNAPNSVSKKFEDGEKKY